MKRTALYRHFDAEGRLLYVGISLDPIRRLTQHMNKAHWAQQIAGIRIEWLPTRGAAVDAEQRAIAEERPLFNVADRYAPEDLDDQDEDEWDDRDGSELLVYPPFDEAAEMEKLERSLAASKPVTAPS